MQPKHTQPRLFHKQLISPLVRWVNSAITSADATSSLCPKTCVRNLFRTREGCTMTYSIVEPPRDYSKSGLSRTS